MFLFNTWVFGRFFRSEKEKFEREKPCEIQDQGRATSKSFHFPSPIPIKINYIFHPTETPRIAAYNINSIGFRLNKIKLKSQKFLFPITKEDIEKKIPLCGFCVTKKWKNNPIFCCAWNVQCRRSFPEEKSFVINSS